MGPRLSGLSSAEYYDRWSGLFDASFGSVFQAGLLPRTDPVATVVWLAERAGVTDGGRVLDAGCGIGGPAMAIAETFDVVIDAVTNSPVQADTARRRVAAAGLTDRIEVHLGDYHHLHFADDLFDTALLFETTGYSHDKAALMREIARVVAPGGTVYAKDVFCKGGPLSADQEAAMHEFDRLWGCAASPTLDELAQAFGAAGLADVTAAELDLSTDRLLGAMFTFGPDGVEQTELGRHFYRDGLDPPVLFGEVRGVKPR